MSLLARRRLVAVLVVVASLAAVGALAVGYVQRAVIDDDQFANRATAALRDDGVRALLAERITDEVVLAGAADLVAARPLIESLTSSLVGGSAFGGLFRSAVRDVHRALLDRDQDTLTLTVADVGTVLAAALEAVRPALAERARTAGAVRVVSRDVGDVGGRLARAADDVRALTVLLLVVALLAAVAALVLSRERRRTVVHLGIGAVAGGVALVVLLGVLHSLALGSVEDGDARAAADAVWDAFLGDLRNAAWILAGTGAVIAAAAASLIRPVAIDEPLRRALRAVAIEPQRPWLRAVRGVGFVLGGVLVLLDGRTALALLTTLAGSYLVFAGVSALLRLAAVPDAGRSERVRVPRAPGRLRPLLVAVLAAAIVGGAIAAFIGGGGVSTPAPAAGPCNGSRALCGRTLPEVALPATHNSMSVPLPGWFSAEQDAPIAAQLRAGVRGLLIDTHYADRLDGGRLRTDVGDPAELRANARRDGVSPQAVDAALRLRERLGFAGRGTRGMYLCHSFCELGGTRLDGVLRDLRDFLVANPREVVVVINQDYVTPADFVGAVRDAGLEELAYRGPVGPGRWPTLRQMIDRDERVVFLAENRAGAAPWYRLAYAQATQETPYSFSRPSQLTDPARRAATCRPNRGPADAPLFLVNHWTTTDPVPLPSHADRVNAYGPLLARLRACQRLRGRLPNLVAVNFYRRGDLFRAVAALNREARP